MNNNNGPLQPLNHLQMNAKSNLPYAAPKRASAAISKPQGQQQQKKRKEKLSSLCKTPPSLVKNSSGRGFRRGGFLGEGGFARCFQMKDDTGKVFAAKTVARASIKNEKTKQKLLSEIRIHKSLKHDNIVQFVDCFEDDANVYILLEICPNQSLMDLLKRRKLLSEAEVRFFMVQIVGAIKYLRSRSVVHRDLKLGNIFFDPEMNLKIGDFGLAATMNEHQRRYTICGTPNYIAPEVLLGKNGGHGYEVDIWAIGIMMYALLFGKPPFQCKDVNLIYERIKNNEYSFPEDSKVSNEARILIRDLLSTNPLERPTIDDIWNYPWFTCGPFPERITEETLTQEPEYLNSISKEASLINLTHAKERAKAGSTFKNPLAIVKNDLQSEKPSRLLPHSLSPENTKNKYKEVSPARLQQGNNNIGAKLNSINRRDTATRILNDALSLTLNNISKISEGKLIERSATALDDSKPEMISKWVDYSNKHGFAYQLSTGTVGVLFKEGHTVLKSVQTGYYICPDEELGWRDERFIADKEHTPRELVNEMHVLNYFQTYMMNNLSEIHNQASSSQGQIFLRRYYRNKDIVFFELSNGSYQFNFNDHHKIVLSGYGHVITHITPEKQIETLPLGYVLKSGNFKCTVDRGFKARFQFIKDVLRSKLVV